MEELKNPISITEENNKADIDQWFQDAAKQTFDTLFKADSHRMKERRLSSWRKMRGWSGIRTRKKSSGCSLHLTAARTGEESLMTS
jgi:hypothetical protein